MTGTNRGFLVPLVAADTFPVKHNGRIIGMSTGEHATATVKLLYTSTMEASHRDERRRARTATVKLLYTSTAPYPRVLGRR